MDAQLPAGGLRLGALHEFAGGGPGAVHGAAAVLFVAGALSDYVPQDSLGVIRGLFPRAHLQVLPQAGHWLHAEQPAAFAACVWQFLAGVASDSASIGVRTH